MLPKGGEFLQLQSNYLMVMPLNKWKKKMNKKPHKKPKQKTTTTTHPWLLVAQNRREIIKE